MPWSQFFWMLSFKPTFSPSSFTFIKRLFNCSLSAIRVVSSAYLRLLIFLPAILIPACASSSPAPITSVCISVPLSHVRPLSSWWRISGSETGPWSAAETFRLRHSVAIVSLGPGILWSCLPDEPCVYTAAGRTLRCLSGKFCIGEFFSF